jgi:chromosomal replication initiator protein
VRGLLFDMGTTDDYKMNDLEQAWTQCSAELRQEVPEPAWNAWIAPLRLLDADAAKVALAAPNSVVRDVVLTRYQDLLQRALAQHTGFTGQQIEISVLPPRATNPADADADADNPPAGLGQTGFATAIAAGSSATMPSDTVAPSRSSANPPDHPPKPARAGRGDQSALNPRYTFEAFVIGASNRFAHAAARRVAEEPAKAYNPLFIYGSSGLGKTHMLHAIGHYVFDNFTNFNVCYVSTETFLNDLIDAIRTNDQTRFKRRYRGYDVLLVDDVQFLEGKPQTQEEFFHTFNSFYEAEKQIVLSSDRHPRDIATLEGRLRSRFECGLITDVQPPELETRLAILRKKSEGRVAVPDDVLELIATHIKDNIRELEGALNRLSAFASIHNAPITLSVAEDLLDDVIRAAPPKPVTLEEILVATADFFNFSQEEIRSQSRRRPLVWARQAAMYLSRELTDSSFPEIARFFGDRDHTTVIHAYRKVVSLMGEKKQIYEQVAELTRKIKESN